MAWRLTESKSGLLASAIRTASSGVAGSGGGRGRGGGAPGGGPRSPGGGGPPPGGGSPPRAPPGRGDGDIGVGRLELLALARQRRVVVIGRDQRLAQRVGARRPGH